MDTGCWIIVAVIAVIFVLTNRDLIIDIFRSKPEKKSEQIKTDEFIITKPVGFYIPKTKNFPAEIYSTEMIVKVSRIDGKNVTNQFNSAWAVISVASFSEVSREIVFNSNRQYVLETADEILSESEITTAENGERQFAIITLRKPHGEGSNIFEIETVHKFIESLKHNKIYELRASILTDSKTKYGAGINEIVDSFQVL